MCCVERMVGHLCFGFEGFKVNIQGSKDEVNFRECF